MVRSRTLRPMRSSSVRCCAGDRSSSKMTASASCCCASSRSSTIFPSPTCVAGSGCARRCVARATTTPPGRVDEPLELVERGRDLTVVPPRQPHPDDDGPLDGTDDVDALSGRLVADDVPLRTAAVGTPHRNLGTSDGVVSSSGPRGPARVIAGPAPSRPRRARARPRAAGPSASLSTAVISAGPSSSSRPSAHGRSAHRRAGARRPRRRRVRARRTATAAQAPVPQAAVSPTPRSRTRAGRSLVLEVDETDVDAFREGRVRLEVTTQRLERCLVDRLDGDDRMRVAHRGDVEGERHVLEVPAPPMSERAQEDAKPTAAGSRSAAPMSTAAETNVPSAPRLIRTGRGPASERTVMARRVRVGEAVLGRDPGDDAHTVPAHLRQRTVRVAMVHHDVRPCRRPPARRGSRRPKPTPPAPTAPPVRTAPERAPRTGSESRSGPRGR
jgi:hypothetical protein